MKKSGRPSRGTLEKWDKSYLWHPFTQMQEYIPEETIIVDRGRGSYLVDVNGTRYLDGISSLWCNIFGHRKAEIDRAITAQLDRIAHSTLLGITNVPAVELAEKLVSITPPNLTKVFYSDNGSTAVEVALKMAFQYWQQAERRRFAARTKFLILENAYHGDTIGSVSLGGISLFHGLYRPLLFETYKAPAPYCYRCPLRLERSSCQMECAGEVEKLVRAHQRDIAGLVMEPVVQGAAGMIVQPPGYVKRMREVCSKHGLFLILDEVATGFGRTGRLFACEHDGIQPDFLCLSKGLTGGYLPMAATLTTDRVFEGFLGRYDQFKTFFHGHTYTGNPLAAAASLATLRIFEQEKVMESLPRKIARLSASLRPLGALPAVGEIRQAGLMVGIELVKNRKSKSPYPVARRTGYRVCREARRHGVLIRPLGDTIVLNPPLSISLTEIDKLVAAVGHSIRAVTARG